MKTPLWPVLWITAIANLVALSLSKYDPDMQCWVTWCKDLAITGFSKVPGNYPPIYQEWLWVVAQLHDLIGIPLDRTQQIFQLLVELPVIVAHVGLVAIVWWIWKGRQPGLVWLTALNPAILLDGPAWGQVDLLPMVVFLGAMVLYVRDSQRPWWLPGWVGALLIKFQAILFLPTITVLVIQDRKRLFRLGAWTLFGAIFILFPFIATGSVVELFHRAYAENTNAFPYSTFNAANLWSGLGHNLLPDDRLLWSPGITADGAGKLLSPGVLGKLLFIAASAWILIRLWKDRSPSSLWWSLFASSVSFVAFLPQMHERYLFSALVVALVGARWNVSLARWAAPMTWILTLNIVLVHQSKGPALLQFLGVLVALSALWVLLPVRTQNVLSRLGNRIPATMGMLLLAVLPSWQIVSSTMEARRLIELQKPVDGSIRISDLTPLEGHQQWGTLQRDRSVVENPLRCHGTEYPVGMGTHASSEHLYEVPPGFQWITGSVCVDDEALAGKLEFQLWSDNQMLWTSGTVEGGNPPVEFRVSVSGLQHIKLVTNSLGPNEFDHADWIAPLFRRN